MRDIEAHPGRNYDAQTGRGVVALCGNRRIAILPSVGPAPDDRQGVPHGVLARL